MGHGSDSMDPPQPPSRRLNKMKFRLAQAEHSHQLTHILADKLFSFLKSLTMADQKMIFVNGPSPS